MSVAVTAADSGAAACTISVTGRTVGTGALVQTVSAAEAGSMHGGGVDEGEMVTGLGGVRGRGDVSLTWGGVESDCWEPRTGGVGEWESGTGGVGESESMIGGIGEWESGTGGMGECLEEGIRVDSSSKSNSSGMSEFALREGGGSMGAVSGGGEGVGGRLS